MTQIAIPDNSTRANTAIISLKLTGASYFLYAMSVFWISFEARKLQISKNSSLYETLTADFVENEPLPFAVMTVLLLLAGFMHIATSYFFIKWFRRAYSNLHKAGIVKEYTDGWAVAFWFIPFLNLLRPYQMMREMFYNTADFLKKNGVATAQLPDPIIARTWWIWFILCTVGISFVDKILELSEMNITFSEEYLIQGISTLFTCIAAFYAVLTVQELFKAEEKIMSIIAEAEPEADYS